MSSISSRPILSDSRERWLLLAVVIFFVVISIFYCHKITSGRSAIDRWQMQIRGLENGENLAERYNYPNPPIMALLLWPIVKLPPMAAALVWFYLKAAMTLLVLVWVFRLVESTDRPFPFWAKVLTVLLSLRPIHGDLMHGNVNLFILFLVVGALTAYRCRRDLLAGAALGLAIACKVTPALFIPYLIWKRSVKALMGVALGLALFLWPGVVPSLVLGYENNQQQLTSWYREMVHPFVVEGKVTPEHENQSLPGVIYRLLTHSPSFSTYRDNQYIPLEYHNFVDLGPEMARWLVKGCMAGFVLLVLWTCRTPTEPRQGWRLSAEFSMIVLGMLLFSERTWKHHCVTQLLPFAVLCYVVSVRSSGRTILIAALAAATILISLTGTDSREDRGAQTEMFGKLAQVYGAYVWAHVVLLAGLAIALRGFEKKGAAVATNPGAAARAA